MIKTWDILYPAPQMLGSFIWEWQSQGVADKFPDNTKDYYFGLDALRQENNKGIVTGYRVPKPELWIVKMAYSPVDVKARSVGASGAIPITNHYSFTDLNELTCRWTALNGGKTLEGGAMKINCAPMQSVTAQFPMGGGRDDAAFRFSARRWQWRRRRQLTGRGRAGGAGARRDESWQRRFRGRGRPGFARGQ